MSSLFVYLIIVADKLVSIFGIIGFLFFVGFLVTKFQKMVCFCNLNECLTKPAKLQQFKNDFSTTMKWYKTWGRWCLPLSILFFSFGILIPTIKETAAIIVVPKIVNNEKVQKIPDLMLDAANKWMKENIKDCNQN